MRSRRSPVPGNAWWSGRVGIPNAAMPRASAILPLSSSSNLKTDPQNVVSSPIYISCQLGCGWNAPNSAGPRSRTLGLISFYLYIRYKHILIRPDFSKRENFTTKTGDSNGSARYHVDAAATACCAFSLPRFPVWKARLLQLLVGHR